MAFQLSNGRFASWKYTTLTPTPYCPRSTYASETKSDVWVASGSGVCVAGVGWDIWVASGSGACVAGVGSDVWVASGSGVCVAGVGSDVWVASGSGVCIPLSPHPSNTMLPMVPIRTIERIRIVIVVIPLFKTEVSNHTCCPLGHITHFPFLNATTLLESDGLSHAWHPPRISIQDRIPHVHVDTTVRTPAAPWMSSLHVQPPVVSPRAAVESMKVLRLGRRGGRLRRTLVVFGAA